MRMKVNKSIIKLRRVMLKLVMMTLSKIVTIQNSKQNSLVERIKN